MGIIFFVILDSCSIRGITAVFMALQRVGSFNMVDPDKTVDDNRHKIFSGCHWIEIIIKPRLQEQGIPGSHQSGCGGVRVYV